MNRQFSADRPNQLWVADISEFPTSQGKLYLAAIRDLHHCGIVGWDTAARQDSILVVNALTMVLTHTGHPADVIHHSDKGTQQLRAGSHGNNATVQLGQQVRASRDPVVR